MTVESVFNETIGLVRRCFVMVSALAVALGLVASACDKSGGASDAPGSKRRKRGDPDFAAMQPFPSAKELDQIKTQTRPDLSQLAQDAPANVSTWTMAEDLPTQLGATPYDGDDPMSKTMAEILGKNPALQPTAQMLCYARERGRFFVEHGGAPPNDIEAFMAARCGVPAASIVATVLTVERPKGHPGTLHPEDHAHVLQGFSKTPEGSMVGSWHGADEDQLVLVLADTRPELKLDPLPLISGGTGSIDIRGQLPWEAEWTLGVVTQGPLGFRTCQPIPGSDRKADEVALRCTVDKGDPWVMLEVLAARRGQLLGGVVLRAYFSPDGSLPASYEAPSYQLPVDPQDRTEAARLDGINALRQRAGLDPLRLSEPQSQAIADLAPHLFDPAQHQFQDDIALGMMAGWSIGDVIRDADLQISRIHPAWGLDRELAGSLISPRFRSTLLDPEANVLASTTIDVENVGARAVVDLTYSVFAPRDFAAEQKAFFDELDLQRAAVGLPPVIRVHGPKDVEVLRQSAERIRAGESGPYEELDFLANHFAQLVQRSFWTTAFAPMRLEGWRPDFPDDLLKHEHLAAAATISYFKPDGAAWGQHIVLMVYTILDGPIQ